MRVQIAFVNYRYLEGTRVKHESAPNNRKVKFLFGAITFISCTKRNLLLLLFFAFVPTCHTRDRYFTPCFEISGEFWENFGFKVLRLYVVG